MWSRRSCKENYKMISLLITLEMFSVCLCIRMCSHQSASSRSRSLKTTTSSTRPPCIGSTSRAGLGSWASIRKESSWRETEWRKPNRAHTLSPDPSKVRPAVDTDVGGGDAFVSHGSDRKTKHEDEVWISNATVDFLLSVKKVCGSAVLLRSSGNRPGVQGTLVFCCPRVNICPYSSWLILQVCDDVSPTVPFHLTNKSSYFKTFNKLMLKLFHIVLLCAHAADIFSFLCSASVKDTQVVFRGKCNLASRSELNSTLCIFTTKCFFKRKHERRSRKVSFFSQFGIFVLWNRRFSTCL